MTYCPVHPRDARRTAAIATPSKPGAITSYGEGRALLRDPDARQAAFKADQVARFGGRHKPIIFLHGKEHQRQRAATARFFAPRAVQRDYRPLIEREVDRLIAGFAATGEGLLDDMSLQLAVSVAAAVVGLNESDRVGLTQRLERLFEGTGEARGGVLGTAANLLRGQYAMWRFHRADVLPAIRARRAATSEDVISHLLSEGYSDRAILIECVTYGAAGMVTTREFIALAGWHLIERPDLADRFLASEEAGKIAILEEILRLEPVVGMLRRTAGEGRAVREINVRAANVEEAMMGAHPLAIDPERQRADRVGGAGLAFGDGPHRCPGANLAMVESAVFLDRLLRCPGLRIVTAPQVRWVPMISGYELRGFRLACGR